MITASRLFFGQSAVSGLWQCLPKLEFDLIQKSSAMWPNFFLQMQWYMASSPMHSIFKAYIGIHLLLVDITHVVKSICIQVMYICLHGPFYTYKFQCSLVRHA